MSLLSELKRRNVFRVGLFYIVSAWLVIQVAETVLPLFDVPDGALRAVVVILTLGFPLAVIFAWIFELTPDGIKLDTDSKVDPATKHQTAHKLNIATLVAAALAIGLLITDRLVPEASPTAQSGVSTADPVTEPDTRADESAVVGVEESVAVLPFVNMSADPDQEYFSDGMTEEVINKLVRQTDVSVAARTSVFAFKGDNRNVSEIGRELGVTHVIEGSVRSANNTVRITAQLIDVSNGFHRWSETYDRELIDVFAVQEEIAASVAAALSASLEGSSAAPRTLTTDDPEAYNMYLRARSLLRQRTGLDEAADLLGEVTQRDSEFAPAWATAAIVANVRDDNDRAVQFAERALALDPENVDALTALASSHRAQWQWEPAERVFERAMALDPESSELLEDYAEFLGMVGRFDEMLSIAEQGYLIDPYLPPLAAVYAEALMIAGRAEDADRALAASTLYTSPRWFVSFRVAAALQIGRPDQAIEVIRSELPPTRTDIEMVIAVLETPDDERAVAELQTHLFEQLATASYDPFMGSYALLHARRHDVVLRLQQAGVDRNLQGDLEWIFAPLFDDLRALPAFNDYLESVNLPDYWRKHGWPDPCQPIGEDDFVCD